MSDKSSKSWASQVSAVGHVIATLPPGMMRSHFERALEGAHALIAASAVHAEPLSSPPRTSSSPPQSSLAMRLEAASALPLSSKPSSAGALALAVHAALLDSAVGLVCSGAADTPRGAAFAAPHRPVAPQAFAPAGWDEDFDTETATATRPPTAHFRYQRGGCGGGGRIGHGTLFLSLTYDAPSETLRIRARVDRSAHGGGGATATLDLPVNRYTAPIDPAAVLSSPRSFFAAVGAPLDDVILAAELKSAINTALLVPLFGGRDEGGGIGSGSGSSASLPHRLSPPPPQAQPVPTGWLPAVPPNGHYVGDFDADVFPDVRMGVPGALLHRPGGMTVGPDHAIFGNRGEDDGRPPGVPPGARFDPFMPPHGPPGFGGRPLGGPSGIPGPLLPRPTVWGEPSPDHLIPPQNDM